MNKIYQILGRLFLGGAVVLLTFSAWEWFNDKNREECRVASIELREVEKRVLELGSVAEADMPAAISHIKASIISTERAIQKAKEVDANDRVAFFERRITDLSATMQLLLRAIENQPAP